MWKIKKIITWILIVIAALIGLGILLFHFFPFFSRFDPAYKEAQAICDSIKVGTTYGEVKEKFGSQFVHGPSNYIDEDGTGQIWLTNNVKNSQVSCRIKFEKNKVLSAVMMNEAAF
jgi:hypothetical protein